ncbi:MAG: hypothetical protein Q9222_003393 [Ikaeria aurantiellina]
MLFCAPLALLYLTSLCSATPLNRRLIHLYPRQNGTADGTGVARAGGVLNADAAAEANHRDDTATRAFSGVSVKAADGTCLFVDPTAGDFRQNLIPVQMKACDGSANEQFDIITAGKHIDQAGGMLVVSTQTQGCLNFDPRRAANDQVIIFSCGGRADGEGEATDSQIFSFTAGQKSQPLALKSDATACLVPASGKLGSAGCSGASGQAFTIG